ncbi:glutathione S-transferase [Mycena capillaripes]|nr:glutathione S-transferase [Mycena capillaripes]
MVLKLYGSPSSGGGTASVAMVLVEKQIPFEYIPVNLSAGEQKTAEYLAKNPFGQAPVLDDDGFLLYESRAICRYIAEKYEGQGPALIPTELKAKALFEQAASIEFANFEPYVQTIYFETSLKPMLKIPVDQAGLDRAISELSAKLDVYEIILGKQKYLAGDELTLADLFHIGFGPTIARGGCDLLTSKGPNVARWWKDITSRSSWLSIKDGIKSTSA